jgi:hypothetical protein
MNLFIFYLLLMTITASLLIIMNMASLWKNCKGTKFNFIYSIVGLLLLNNIALLALAFADYQIYVLYNIQPLYVWMFSLTDGTNNLTLCISHVLLALKYREVARGRPFDMRINEVS